MKRTTALALALPCAVAAVLGTAAPGAAASAASTRYSATWTFDSGGVTGTVGGLQLTDYTGTTYYDRVTGSHNGGVAVAGNGCGTAPNATNISLYGAEKDWAQMGAGESQGSRVNIGCLIDGAQHRFHWGNHGTANGGYDTGKTDNCVTLTRASQDTFTLDAGTCTVTQDVVYDSRYRQVGTPKTEPIPFTATVTVPGLR